jgi:purine-binding chemotaxis protein CheW
VATTSRQLALLVRSGSRVCALPIEQVVEIMRTLPTSPLPGTAPFVRGAAVIRGEPVPVVDLDSFLGEPGFAEATRFVLVRCGQRRAALAVQAAIGVGELGEVEAGRAPLLDHACGGAVEALGAVDGELLVVLRAGAIVPEQAWRAVSGASS